MKKIVIMSRDDGPDQMLLQFVQIVFPEYEVCVVFPEQDASDVCERKQEVMRGF
jgi:hypothetical protein